MNGNQRQAQWLVANGLLNPNQVPALLSQVAGAVGVDVCELLLRQGQIDASTALRCRQLVSATPLHSTPLQRSSTGSFRLSSLPDSGSFRSALRSKSGVHFVNQVIFGYRIIEELGRGGMGRVFKVVSAQDPGPELAMKIVLHEQDPDAKQLARFRREAKVLESLDHPHIVGVHASGEDQGVPFIVMDLIHGQSLRELVERSLRTRRRPPEIALAVEWFQRMSEALAYCHELGVLHRDLKPDNIIIEKATGSPYLLDFGLTKRIDTGTGEDLEESHNLTKTGEALGTPAYMAPEQWDPKSEFGPPGPPSDVWGLAATFFFAVTGHSPHESASAIDYQIALMTKPARRASSLNSHVPAKLDGLLAECLSRDSKQRPTMDELAEELRDWNVPQRSAAALVSALAVLLLAFVAGIWLWPKDDPKLLISAPAHGFRTKDAKVSVTGRCTGFAAHLVEISGQTQVLKDERSFELELPLKEGENTLLVKALDAEAKVRVTQSLSVTRDTRAPTLTLKTEIPETTKREFLELRGQLSDGQVRIGSEILNLENRRFNWTWVLKEGINTVELRVFDDLGNEAVRRLQVRRQTRPLGLQELINGAAPNSNITLKPGVYRGPFVLPRAIKISALKARTVTIESLKGCAFEVKGGPVTLVDLDIRLIGDKDKHFSEAAVRMHNQELHMTNCVLSSYSRGALVLGGKARFVGTKLTFQNCVNIGIVVNDGARAELTSCLFLKNKKAGVYVSKAQSCLIKGCQFIEQSGHGLFAGETTIHVEDSEFRGNTMSGLTFLKGGRLRAKNCVLKRNKHCGFETYTESESRWENCQFLRNGRAGGFVRDRAKATFNSCRFVRNEDHGLKIIDKGHCHAQYSSFNENKSSGIFLGKVGSLELRNSYVTHNKKFGLVVKNSKFLLADSSVSNNDLGDLNKPKDLELNLKKPKALAPKNH